MCILHPPANRQQLLDGKQNDRVREVRSDKSVAIITQQPWVLKLFHPRPAASRR